MRDPDFPVWKYVSIDIETLGLDHEYCDMIEFGAVIDDMKSPLDKLPQFHCYLTTPKDRYQGEIYAMAMHGEILKRIAKREKPYLYIPMEYLDSHFSLWLKEQGLPVGDKDHSYGQLDPVVVAGKNFANFDLKFLQKIGFGAFSKMHRRILDVGSMYYDPFKDDVPPNLEECLRRAGLEKTVAHTAVEDALDVIRCIRYKHPTPADL